MFIKYVLLTKDGEVSGIVNMNSISHIWCNRSIFNSGLYSLRLDSSHSEDYFLEFIFDSEEEAKSAYELFEWVMSGYGSKSIEGVGSTFKV